jgi:hypothetical protein
MSIFNAKFQISYTSKIRLNFGRIASHAKLKDCLLIEDLVCYIKANDLDR